MQDVALYFQQHAEAVHHVLYASSTIRLVSYLFYGRVLHVRGESVKGCMAQCKYTFCYLIYLDKGIVVQLFELNVQFEEFGSFDVPVEAAGIDIEELVVGQQDIEFVG